MNYIELLQAELRPAFGCTEPIALALMPLQRAWRCLVSVRRL